MGNIWIVRSMMKIIFNMIKLYFWTEILKLSNTSDMLGKPVF